MEGADGVRTLGSIGRASAGRWDLMTRRSWVAACSFNTASIFGWSPQLESSHGEVSDRPELTSCPFARICRGSGGERS
jgi:hypothetical protein